MKELDIKGYKVLLDDEDYDKVAALKWYVDKGNIKKRGRVYFYHGFYYDKKKKYNMSLQRFLLDLPRGSKLLGDHINGNTLDNRRCNLRACTTAENTQNMKVSKSNTTGFKGVYLHKPTNKYVARICINNKRVLLGYFEDPEKAYAAYCEASKKYHGEFGRTE
jgi:hypothetical protein